MMIAVLGRYSDVVGTLWDSLGDAGWVIRSFDDHDALAAAQLRTAPDVVLVDVGSFAGDSGWDIVDGLRADAAWATVPLILSVDHLFEVQNHSERIDDGVAAVLVQPATREDVLCCIQAAQSWSPDHREGRLVALPSTGAVAGQAV